MFTVLKPTANATQAVEHCRPQMCPTNRQVKEQWPSREPKCFIFHTIQHNYLPDSSP